MAHCLHRPQQFTLEPSQWLAGGAVVSRIVRGSQATAPDYLIKGGITYRLLSVVHSTIGAIAQRLDYDAFGRVTQDTAPGFQPFGFAGGLFDTDTGLVRFGARDYDPEPGRWTAKEPLGFAGGDTNLYAYAYGDPINYVDPDGAVPMLVVAIGVGAVIGGGVELGSQLLATRNLACVDWRAVGRAALIGATTSLLPGGGAVAGGLKIVGVGIRGPAGVRSTLKYLERRWDNQWNDSSHPKRVGFKSCGQW